MRVARAIAGAALVLTSLIGCQPARHCLHSHLENRMQPITTCAKTCTTSWLWLPSAVCDQYATPAPTPR
ncbi:MAG: hypothetical protein JWP11_1296 [Frankiales bacterium]|nr:hypothetical protein [Frankiales bacterium]